RKGTQCIARLVGCCWRYRLSGSRHFRGKIWAEGGWNSARVASPRWSTTTGHSGSSLRRRTGGGGVHAGRFPAGSLASSRAILVVAGGGGGGQEVRPLDDVHGEASLGEGADHERRHTAGGELLGGRRQGHRERRAAPDGVAGAGQRARDGRGTYVGGARGAGHAARVGGSGQELRRIERTVCGAGGHDAAGGRGSAHAG